MLVSIIYFLSMPDNFYPYDNGDRLNDRNRYSYTPFVGRPVIEAWQKSRKLIMTQLPEKMPPPDAEVPQGFDPRDNFQSFKCADLMEWVLHNLASVEHDEVVQKRVAFLVERFEVTKRFHSTYSPALRAVDKTAYKDLGLYIRGGEIFIAAYEITNKLPYLNAFMKVMDTLCSQRLDFCSKDAARLANLIDKELAIVTRLYEVQRNDR